ncbi:MAP3K epsilon protein kinase 1-like [Zea mays]|uniref:MAP3K epsilon protein kinase 1-like n=1 Tax=Zea mays TaxID=4577 RepID=UPI000221074F|nr:MAP3K epsilon protein kinase 1-like [Zea mays]|eukprot:XP_008678892.1 MAP3K epsilon protein kinase 1-like [Zea mays]
MYCWCHRLTSAAVCPAFAVYLNLLEDDAWACTTLDSITVCLAHDNDHRKVEQALLKKEAIQNLVKFFQDCPEQFFGHILDAFLKIITKSSRLNTAMATNGLTTLLIARLDHSNLVVTKVWRLEFI